MTQAADTRTIFADSSYAERLESGAFRLILPAQVPVGPEDVLFLDDASLSGASKQVASHNDKLYVVERTPKQFTLLGQKLKLTNTIGQPEITFEANPWTSTADLAQFPYKIVLPKTDLQPLAAGVCLLKLDDTEVLWIGRLYHRSGGCEQKSGL